MNIVVRLGRPVELHRQGKGLVTTLSVAVAGKVQYFSAASGAGPSAMDPASTSFRTRVSGEG